MSPCPKCGTIRVRESDVGGKTYKMECDCGFATNNSSWSRSEKRVKKLWEEYLAVYRERHH